jgi:hypothetical protein
MPPAALEFGELPVGQMAVLEQTVSAEAPPVLTQGSNEQLGMVCASAAEASTRLHKAP